MNPKSNVERVQVTAGVSDSSLAARELNFLVRLAQAAASTQRPDELLELIIRETTSAIGADGCSLYLLAGRAPLLTATNALNENMGVNGTMRARRAIPDAVTHSPRPPATPTH